MPSNARLYRQIGLLTSIGVSFAVASAGGFWLGSWLDGKLGTKPWLTLVLGLLGVLAAFVNLVRTLSQAERLDPPPTDGRSEPPGPPEPERSDEDNPADPGRP